MHVDVACGSGLFLFPIRRKGELAKNTRKFTAGKTHVTDVLRRRLTSSLAAPPKKGSLMNKSFVSVVVTSAFLTHSCCSEG